MLFIKFVKGFLNDSPTILLTLFIDKFWSVFISVYRKAYSANDVLIRFTKNWKQ